MYNREQIYEALRNQIPYISRHENTERVMSGVNALLDQLILIQQDEELEAMTDGELCTDTD
jgi:putative NIF3 family GTP cyclohydrolase 1 type 2